MAIKLYIIISSRRSYGRFSDLYFTMYKTQDSPASCHQRMREREKHLSKAVAVVTCAFLTSLILVLLRQMQA